MSKTKTANPLTEDINPEENPLNEEVSENATVEAGQETDGSGAGQETGANGGEDGNGSQEDVENKAEEARNVGPEVNSEVQNLLRIFNGYDELYITKFGGVFPKGNLPSHVKGAVLYKNPFFKKKQ